MDNTNDSERPGNTKNDGKCPGGVPDASAEQPGAPTAASALKCIAWCPDDGDESIAREYSGSTVPEIAEQHAEHVHYEQGTQRDCYEVRVRATRGDRVREWDVTVDVEIEVSFSGVLAFPVKASKKSDAPEPLVESTP